MPMTYAQLLPVYQRITGLPGNDNTFNAWVQGVINHSGSANGIQGIPDNWLDSPQGQQYVQSTTGVGGSGLTQTNTGGGGTTGGLPVGGNTTGTGTGTGTTAPGFGALLPPSTGVTPGTTATVPNTTGGNYNQTENGNQSGQFSTIGDTSTNQSQTTGGTSTNNTTGTSQNDTTQNTAGTNQQNTTGTNTNNTSQNTSGTQNQQGTTGSSGVTQNVENINQNANTTGTQNINQNTTTQALDSLGFGSLLQGAAGSAATNDANRNAFLTDTMKTGGSALNSQVDQAVRQSLSGPQAVGAGQSAQGRAAGYAAAQIARNNNDQRLAAANQLAGPTSLETLSSAANPYIGQSAGTTGQNTNTSSTNTTGQNTTNGMNQTSGFSDLTGTNSGSTTGTSAGTSSQDTSGATTGSMTGSNTGSTTGTNTGATTGFSNLVGSQQEAQAGGTTAQTSQAGSGLIPQGQPVKTGGCVLCTAGIELALPGSRLHRVLRRVIRHKLHVETRRFSSATRGYFFAFTPLARYLLSHRWLASLLWPLARAVVYEELRVSGKRLSLRVGAWTVHWFGHAICSVLGKLPVAGHVTDPLINEIARREGISFEVRP